MTQTQTTAPLQEDHQFTILVVDDEPDVPPMVRQRLRPEIRQGKYSFLFAGDGAEALETMREHREVDMVISDINMPRMDGLTLIERVSECNPEVRSVIVSAYGDMQNIRKAMNRGAFDFITKPLDFEDLKVTIERTRENIIAWREATRYREQLLEIQQELSVASRMQRAILPTTFPQTQEYNIHGTMTPAREVSGDFFDVISLDHGRVAMAIADVSGKGIPAALFMMSSRTLLKGVAIGLQSPSQVLSEVNRLLCQDNENTMFITLLYAVYDPGTGELTYANGGHCHPILAQPDSPCQELPTTRGVALGLVPELQYQEHTVALPPGSTLMMFTDGVSEAMDSHGQEFGTNRLEQALQQHHPESALLANATVLQAVQDFTGGIRQSDDITCLTLHRSVQTQ